MSSESDRSYELLGVRPGVSRQELKVAYRDLAKVWHPDRFAHDPRLQEKAQEKLKEINDAYEELVSWKTMGSRIIARASRARGRAGSSDFKQANLYSSGVAGKPRRSIWLLIPVIVFSSVFIFTVRYLHNHSNSATQALIEQDTSVESADPGSPVETAADNGRVPKRRVDGRSDVNSGEVNAIATTTVVIDSATGLLARAECPSKVRMTYPSGHEPRVYCTAHPVTTTDGNLHQPKESRLKTLKRKSASSTEVVDESDKVHPNR